MKRIGTREDNRKGFARFPDKKERGTSEAEEWLRGHARVEPPEPRAGFKEVAYSRIIRRLAEDKTAGHGARRALRTSTRLRKAVLIPAISLVIIILLTGGAYAFSLGSNPDSSLYPVKLFFEKAGSTLTTGSEAKMNYHLRLVDKRMGELAHLVEGGCSRGGDRWERAFLENIDWIIKQFSSLEQGRQGELATYIEERLGACSARMEELRSLSPDALIPYIDRVRDRNRGAMQMMHECRMRHGNMSKDSSGEETKPESGGEGSEGPARGESRDGMMQDPIERKSSRIDHEDETQGN